MRSEPGYRPPLTARERALWACEVFVLLALMWLALNGTERWLVGTLVALAGAGLAAWLAVNRPRPLTLRQIVPFLGFFLVGSLRGGIDVAWRALHPRLPIEPQFRRFALDLPQGQPRTFMVSILSLMPGTLSVELEDDGATLVVHALTASALTSVTTLHVRVRELFGVVEGAAEPTLGGPPSGPAGDGERGSPP
jgi:multicomponent Na+:H+ antiporter subunit E